MGLSVSFLAWGGAAVFAGGAILSNILWFKDRKSFSQNWVPWVIGIIAIILLIAGIFMIALAIVQANAHLLKEIADLRPKVLQLEEFRVVAEPRLVAIQGAPAAVVMSSAAPAAGPPSFVVGSTGGGQYVYHHG